MQYSMKPISCLENAKQWSQKGFLVTSSTTRPILNTSPMTKYETTFRPLSAKRIATFPTYSARHGFSDRAHSSRVPSQRSLHRRSVVAQVNTPILASSTSEGSDTPVPAIHSSYEKQTGTWQYVVADPSTLKAVIIDSVLDYDPLTQTISTSTADALLSIVRDNCFTIERILETHAHADHLTAASYLQNRLKKSQGFRPPIGIGKRITSVQELFGQRYGIPEEEYRGVFDELFDDDESFEIGALTATVLHLPGHTADHVGYMIGDNVFCGDSVFNADIGTARADFPGGSATALYNSGQKLLRLPEHFKIWFGHDYTSEERQAPIPHMSVGEHRKNNTLLSQTSTEYDFVSRRKQRDAMLAQPKLLNPSLQINIRAGRLPRTNPLGQRLLHLPLKLAGQEF